MKFKNLEIYNVGPYRKRTIFSFDEANKDKPLILIRGHNGAGKTHVFESIKYCLFGNRILNGIKEKEFLRDFTHKPKNNFKLSDSFSYVSLEIFDSIENNEVLIKRSWEENDQTSSTLEVKILTKDKRQLDKDEFQNYIDKLIPFNYSELFFYDGEEVKSKYKKSRPGLFSLLDSIYGIKVINQSINDIKKVVKELIKKADIEKEYESLVENFNTLDSLDIKERSEIENLKDEMISLNLIISEINKKKDQIFLKFKELGGKYIVDLEKNNKKFIKNNEKKTILTETFKRLSEKKIPLLLCPNMSSELEKGYNKKREEEKLKIIKNFLLQEQVKDIVGDEAIKRLNEITLDEKSYKNQLDKKVSSNLKNAEKKSVIKCIDDILINIAKSNELKRAIDNVPLHAPDEIKQIKKYESQIFDLMSKKEGIAISLHDLEAANIRTIKEREACQKKIKIGRDQDQKTKLEKTLKVLEEFKNKIYVSKDKILKEKLIDRIGLLARKKELIQDIEIDSKKYSVTYKDKNGRRIPKFSAGENHILSVAWIWALSDLSQRDIPFVIDTPMGSGLDEVHRKNLIDVFLRKLSSQTIVLSNDDEIDDKSAKLLNNIVSTTYRISNKGDETTMREINEQ